MINKIKPTEGFTLVELSIVIIIIGFLIAGISGGASLVKQAALSSVITDLTNFRMAVNAFKSKYDGLPGDLKNAYAWFGSACGANTVGAADSCNGNGDGYIGVAPWWNVGGYEDLRAWQHLSLAGLVQGSYTGLVDSATIREAAGSNVPASKIQGAGYSWSKDDPASFYNLSVANINLITLGGYSGGSWSYLGGSVNATDGQVLDNKMDDGNNMTGDVLVVGEHDSWGWVDYCAVGSSWATLAATGQPLNYADNRPTCRIVYRPADFQS